MKIYNGWVVSIKDKEFKVVGRQTIRSTTRILFKGSDGQISCMNRDKFIELFNEGVIQYVRSEAV